MENETLKLEAAALLLTGIIEEVLVNEVADEVMSRIQFRIRDFCLHGSKSVQPPGPEACAKAEEFCERLRASLHDRQNTDQTAVSIFYLE